MAILEAGAITSNSPILLHSCRCQFGRPFDAVVIPDYVALLDQDGGHRCGMGILGSVRRMFPAVQLLRNAWIGCKAALQTGGRSASCWR
jgi:hypothetical protein